MENSVNKKQNRKVMIFACILSVISIGLLIFGFFLVSSDKVVLLQSISNLFNKYNELTEDGSILTDKIATSKNIGLTSNISIAIDDLNASVKFNYLENKEQEKTKIDLYFDINEEEMLDTNIVLSDDKAHFFIENITPNYYHTDFEYITIFSELKSSDYEQIENILKDVITNYIDNEDIDTEKVTISYNGKDKKVNKLTYKITNKAIKNVVTEFFDSLKKDKTLLEKLATSLDTTTADIETSMNEILASLDYEEETVLYNYVVYYYGFNKIVGYEIEEIETNTILEYKIQDVESINIYSEGSHLLNIDITTDKNQHSFSGFIEDEDEKIVFTGTIIDNVITINVDDMKCVISYKSKENNFDTEYDITLYSITDNNEEEVANIEISLQYYFDKEISVSLDNSINIDDITEEEMNTIYTNLMNHPLYILISEFLMGDYESEL